MSWTYPEDADEGRVSDVGLRAYTGLSFCLSVDPIRRVRNEVLETSQIVFDMGLCGSYSTRWIRELAAIM